MKRRTILLATAMLMICGVAAWAAGIDGKWTGQAPGMQGPMDISFVFKADGEKLTGTMSNARGEATISEGTIKGDAVSFKVVREFNGNKITIKYTGKLAGDELKLTRSFEGEGPGGQTPPPVDFTVKRAAN